MSDNPEYTIKMLEDSIIRQHEVVLTIYMEYPIKNILCMAFEKLVTIDQAIKQSFELYSKQCNNYSILISRCVELQRRIFDLVADHTLTEKFQKVLDEMTAWYKAKVQAGESPGIEELELKYEEEFIKASGYYSFTLFLDFLETDSEEERQKKFHHALELASLAKNLEIGVRDIEGKFLQRGDLELPIKIALEDNYKKLPSIIGAEVAVEELINYCNSCRVYLTIATRLGSAQLAIDRLFKRLANKPDKLAVLRAELDDIAALYNKDKLGMDPMADYDLAKKYNHLYFGKYEVLFTGQNN